MSLEKTTTDTVLSIGTQTPMKTPMPWIPSQKRWIESFGHVVYSDAPGQDEHDWVALVQDPDDMDLIAAAPDLYQACEAAYDALALEVRYGLVAQRKNLKALEALRSAIDKADGKGAIR